MFAIFEGGGAKGIAHLGAVTAVEANGFAFAGVAGASAGALVAALLSVGYTSRELMNTSSPTSNLLSSRNLSPITFFGQDNWSDLARLQRRFRHILNVGKALGLCGAFLASPFDFMTAVRAYRSFGHFSTEPIRKFINDVIRDKLLDAYADAGLDADGLPDRIRFRDLDESRLLGVLPLKIVVTNVDLQRLEIFDRARTPDVEVGEAVAASAAIPFVFKPARITSYRAASKCRFADGGLVSNLPVWAFKDKKLAFERANPASPSIPVVAFRLVEPPKKITQAQPQITSAAGFADYLGAVARTAIFGGQAVSLGMSNDLLIVSLETNLHTMGFDAGWTEIKDAHDSGRRCAMRVLKQALVLHPERIKAELKNIVEGLHGLLDEYRERIGDQPVGFIRGSLILPTGATTLRVTHTYNMEGDADDRMLLDRRGRGAGTAFRLRRPFAIDLAAVEHADDRPDYMTKYERALRRQDLRYALYIPLFKEVDAWSQDKSDRKRPIGALCVDSGEHLEVALKATGSIKWLIQKSDPLSYIIPQLQQIGERNGQVA